MQNIENSLEIQARLSQHAENYNFWIYETIRPYAGMRILEVGCAIGNITKYFLDRELLVSIDIEEFYVNYVSSKFASCQNFKAFVFDIVNPGIVEALRDYHINTVLCINVLEHVEDDCSALANIYNILEPAGRLIMFLPAFSVLYGSMDKTDNHYRRYDKKEILRILSRIGFQVEASHYFNLPGFLGWFINGRLLKRKFLPINQLRIMNSFVPFLKIFEKMMPPPFGQSLFLVCKK